MKDQKPLEIHLKPYLDFMNSPPFRVAVVMIGLIVIGYCLGHFLLQVLPDRSAERELARAAAHNPKDIALSPKPIASPEVRAVMKKFDPKYRKGDAHRNGELEQQIPTDEWIQRLLNMGIKIENYSDYSAYLSGRWRIFQAQNDPKTLEDLKQRYSLASEASLDEIIEEHIYDSVQLHTQTEQATAMDSRVYGGSLSQNGVFIPKRAKTVYVQPGTIRGGIGVPEWVVHEIRDRDIGLPSSREIPDDIDIIYLDEKGQPIKDKVLPKGIEAELTEGLSPARFDKAQQFIDQFGTEEGLRRLRESDPDAARQFEQGLRGEKPRSLPSSDSGQSPSAAP